MTNLRSDYPDISDILARKRDGRAEVASRSFGQKIDMLDAMRQRVEPIRQARDKRQAAKLPTRNRD